MWLFTKITFGGVCKQKRSTEIYFLQKKDGSRDTNEVNHYFLGGMSKTGFCLKAKIMKNHTRFIECLIEPEGNIMFHISYLHLHNRSALTVVVWFYRARRLNYPSVWSSAFPPWLVSDVGVTHHFKRNEKCLSSCHRRVRNTSEMFWKSRFYRLQLHSLFWHGCPTAGFSPVNYPSVLERKKSKKNGALKQTW